MFFKVLAAIVAADAFRSHREEQEREAWVAAWQRAVATVPPPPAAPSPEVAFRRGAAGERAVGERLDERLADGHSVVLHDRRMPGGRGNIDHLVVAPTGVYVVDAKDVQGKVRVAAPLSARRSCSSM